MPKVICFDFDDVLTDKSTLSKFARLFGHKFKELEYGIRLLEDNRNPKKFFRDVKGGIKLAKGVPYEYVERIGMLTRLNKNAKRVIKKLKKGGHNVVIISINDEGLIKKFLKKNEIGSYVDHVYASRLGVKNGILTGKIFGDVLKTEKVGVVKRIEKLYHTKKEDIIYVGDGFTDLPIMKKVGKGILFCPNPLANAEVLADKQLMKMQNEERLFLIKENDLTKILQFIS